MKHVVLIAGLFDESLGVAVVNRYRSLAKSLTYAGLDPVFISNLESRDSWNPANYLPLPSMGSRAIGRRLQSRLFELNLHCAIRRLNLEPVAAIIIPRNLATFRLLLLNALCWRLPIVVDCMEWHEHWQFQNGRLSPAYWRFLWSFHLVVPRAQGVLAISSYLRNHFSARGVHSLRVLPQMDVDEYKQHRVSPESKCINLFYAGTPHKKDNLGLVLSALSGLTPMESSGIRFTVAGVSEPELRSLAIEAGVMWDSVSCLLRVLGRIPREVVLEELASMDFLVLLRSTSRYANAGFPSKVSESLAAGTPVIVNLTSDLSEFLVEGQNAVIVRQLDVDGVLSALRRALALGRPAINAMSSCARSTALNEFDVRAHTKILRDFFNF